MTSVLIPIVLLGGVDLVTTIRLLRSNAYQPRQKLLQCFLIWLVPVLGFAWVTYMLGEDSSPSPTTNPNADRDDLQARDLDLRHPVDHS